MLLTQDDIGHEYKIWVPCDADSDTVDDLVQQLVAIAGGMSAQAVQGIWISDETGEAIQEDTHILSFITDKPQVLVLLRQLAVVLLEEGQEAVLMTSDGRGFLLRPDLDTEQENVTGINFNHTQGDNNVQEN